MPAAEALAAIKKWRGKYPSNEIETGEAKDYQDGVIVSNPDPIFSKPIYERLIQCRKQKNLTQVELAELVGTTQANISSMEKGKRPIGKEVATKLGEALGVDYHLFL
jgi:DNA-binding XRE family transcriptional regulator